jgi:hypothetical protein
MTNLLTIHAHMSDIWPKTPNWLVAHFYKSNFNILLFSNGDKIKFVCIMQGVVFHLLQGVVFHLLQGVVQSIIKHRGVFRGRCVTAPLWPDHEFFAT